MLTIPATQLFTLALATSVLGSCSLRPSSPPLGIEKSTKYTVDQAATVLTAYYGKTYQLEGNVIARYPDFDLAHIRSIQIGEDHLEKSAGHYDSFEVRDTNGNVLLELQVTPDNSSTPRRFKVNQHYYFITGGSSTGSIRVSLPQHQLAQFNVLDH